MGYGVVLITASSEEEGIKIAEILVNEKLAACVNILKDVSSIFFWEGKLCKEKEILLIIKTKEALFDRLIDSVRKIHGYSVPEIIFIPVTKGFERYLKFIDDSTASSD